jgi:hypothetical protein
VEVLLLHFSKRVLVGMATGPQPYIPTAPPTDRRGYTKVWNRLDGTTNRVILYLPAQTWWSERPFSIWFHKRTAPVFPHSNAGRCVAQTR